MVDEVYQTNDDAEMSNSAERHIGLRQIIIDWGFLLIPYNFLLVLLSGELFGGMPLIDGLLGMVAFNVCFLAGPFVDSYLSWLGFRSRRLTAILFFGGCMLTVLYATAISTGMFSFFFVCD